MGHGEVIRPGDLQHMTAGTGILHSEFNPSKTEPVHLLQIWIMPEQRGLTPGYSQTHFPAEQRRNRLQLLASHDGRDGSIRVRQDVSMYAATLDAQQRVSHDLAPGRHAWLQVIRGRVDVNGRSLDAGDGASLSDERVINIVAHDDAEFLLFDLA
jgi:redox-sensitive bicupin YhaK (pirin superfamily)